MGIERACMDQGIVLEMVITFCAYILRVSVQTCGNGIEFTNLCAPDVRVSGVGVFGAKWMQGY